MTVTVTEVLMANINKLDNLKVPVKEEGLFNALKEVSHDLKVCVQVMQEASAQAAEAQKPSEKEQEEPQDETDAQ